MEPKFGIEDKQGQFLKAFSAALCAKSITLSKSFSCPGQTALSDPPFVVKLIPGRDGHIIPGVRNLCHETLKTIDVSHPKSFCLKVGKC